MRNKTRSKTAESDKTFCLFVSQAIFQILPAQLHDIVEKSGNKDWAIRLEDVLLR